MSADAAAAREQPAPTRAAATPQLPRLAAPVRVALLAAGVMACAVVGLILAHRWFGSPLGGDVWWALPLVIVLSGVFEYAVFNVHLRGEPMSVSLSELPTAIAVVFLSTPLAVAGRLPLALVVLVLLRRNPWYKVVLNVALFTFDVVVASLVFRGLEQWWGDSTPAQVVAATIAVSVVGPVDVLVVSGAIAQFAGDFVVRLGTELRATWWIYTINAGVAAMVVSLMLVEPWLGLIAVAPLCGIWFVQWQYGEQLQRLRDLDAVHGFAGRVGGTLDLVEIGDAAVAETVRLLRAQGAALVRFDRGSVAALHIAGDVPLSLPHEPSDASWYPLLNAPTAQVVNAERLRALGVFESVPASVIVAPVRDSATTEDADPAAADPFAALIVVERLGQSNRFDAADVDRVANLATQLATSLRRGLLHERLEYEARHDALTDLPSRTLFERSVADAVANYDPAHTVCVLMLDLDRFKEVNDTLGHHAGDTVLVAFAERVGALLRPGDVLARLAGDEFALLCWRSSLAEVAEFATAVVQAAGEPVVVDALEIVVTASVGVAAINAADQDAVQPMRRADIAMYNAKWQRTGVEFYRDEIDRRTPARLSMLGDLRTAIMAEQLDVVYQPKLAIGTGEVAGLEALVRWEHPARGVVAPSDFVRVAEDTGLIKELTDLVLSRGIAQLAALRAEGIVTSLAVNVSTHDLFDSRLPDRVRGYLDRHGLPAEMLTLEITESSLFVDAPRTRATIDGLHAVGLRMAIDDFGTGYSSLAYLRQLPVHELKIDGSFVQGMLTDSQDEVIVRSTVDLGHNLGLRIVAEGVESLAALQRLAEFGCDVAQGFVIAEPMRASRLVPWLHEVKRALAVGDPMPWGVVTDPPATPIGGPNPSV